ncbi:MAG: extracellular solute-binding protein [Nitrospiraceae bacterium]|nr:extracellular solute-binding protein [Nitrospiraceae bacterium]
MSRLPFGPAPTLLIVVCVLTAAWLALAPGPDVPPDGVTRLHVLTFAQTHYDAYKVIIPEFEASHPGVHVKLELGDERAVTSRLQSAFWAGTKTPDLVEVEIGAVGMFFRGPLDEIGFTDLTDRVHETGLYDRIVQSRFAPWSSRGRIFGLPHDVHPVMLAYRRDLFEKEGVDPADLDTWDKFVAAGRRMTRDMDGDGIVDQYMIELSDSAHGDLEPLLFQRGGGYFDADGALTMDNAIAVETLAWYVPLVVGPGQIANSLGAGQILTQAMEDGFFLCLLCPDWRSAVIENDMPRLSGKMGLMPLPRAEPGGRGTSTWGGTMVGIPKQSPHPDLAWELALYLYYAPEPFEERFRNTNILPPTRDAWDLPAISEPRAYWGGQRIGDMFVSIADETPPQYTSPYTPLAKTKLGEAVLQCVDYYKHNGEEGFRDFVAQTLKEKADDIRALLERNPFL